MDPYGPFAPQSIIVAMNSEARLLVALAATQPCGYCEPPLRSFKSTYTLKGDGEHKEAFKAYRAWGAP